MKRLLIAITFLVGAFSYGQVFAFSSSIPTGTLIVKGDPGTKQSTRYDISHCGGTIDFLEKFRCVNMKRGILNESVSLNEGIYELNYQNTRKVVQIKANEEKTEVLDQIEIDGIDNSSASYRISYSVFWDLTDKDMQHAFLMQRWSSGSSWGEEKPCGELSTPLLDEELSKACHMHLSDNFEEYVGLFRFHKNGSWDGLTFSNINRAEPEQERYVWWRGLKRYQVNESVTIDVPRHGPKYSVAVFRGTYIIQFRRETLGPFGGWVSIKTLTSVKSSENDIISSPFTE